MRKVFIIKMCRVNRGTFQFYTPISWLGLSTIFFIRKY
jgi:hypothetical protein